MSDESFDPEPTSVEDTRETNNASAVEASRLKSKTTTAAPMNNANQYAPPQTKKRSTPCIGQCWQKPKFPTLGVEDIMDPNFGKMLLAEFLGTCLLVFFGIGSCITSTTANLEDLKTSPGPGDIGEVPLKRDEEPKYYVVSTSTRMDPLHISFAFGLAVATIAQAIGHVSGAHLNPAVSFGLMIAGKCSLLKALLYTVVQCFGSLLGASLLWLATHHIRRTPTPKESDALTYKSTFYEKHPLWGMGTSTLAPGVGIVNGILTEFTLTFLLVFTVCSVCDDLRKDIKGSAPLAIGLAVFVTHLTGIGFTGASVNPARSFGPAIITLNTQALNDLLVYIVGPILGGMEAGFIYSAFFSQRQ